MDWSWCCGTDGSTAGGEGKDGGKQTGPPDEMTSFGV